MEKFFFPFSRSMIPDKARQGNQNDANSMIRKLLHLCIYEGWKEQKLPY